MCGGGASETPTCYILIRCARHPTSQLGFRQSLHPSVLPLGCLLVLHRRTLGIDKWESLLGSQNRPARRSLVSHLPRHQKVRHWSGVRNPVGNSSPRSKAGHKVVCGAWERPGHLRLSRLACCPPPWFASYVCLSPQPQCSKAGRNLLEATLSAPSPPAATRHLPASVPPGAHSRPVSGR